MLTTHVLDLTHGLPADQMQIQVWYLDNPGGERTLLKTVRTGPNGRPDTPLLADDEMKAGTYELLFSVGEYFSTQAVTTSLPPFLDLVPIRCGLADSSVHYHVPLLVSPWAYSTYRGS
ncbi:hydroxyisourate hydrolase [Tengunoibacter tsumagoiensis]|nr:hydroxyisourate hydrolase [Tengunoibacter tsumagoiensis]